MKHVCQALATTSLPYCSLHDSWCKGVRVPSESFLNRALGRCEWNTLNSSLAFHHNMNSSPLIATHRHSGPKHVVPSGRIPGPMVDTSHSVHSVHCTKFCEHFSVPYVPCRHPHRYPSITCEKDYWALGAEHRSTLI